MSRSMIGMFLYTQIYNCNTKLELCSMATRGGIAAALSTILIFEAFSGVHGQVVQGLNTADRAVFTCYHGYGFLLCNYIWGSLKYLLFEEFAVAHRAPLNSEPGVFMGQVSASIITGDSHWCKVVI